MGATLDFSRVHLASPAASVGGTLPPATTGTFTAAPATVATTSCPPGYHYEPDDTASSIRGITRSIAACVPDAAAPAATLPAPAVAAPAAAPALVCPAPWPLWWLLVAGAAGAAGGYWARQNKKTVRKNIGRAVNAGASRAAGFALGRVFG
jgi:hypothetical protein